MIRISPVEKRALAIATAIAIAGGVFFLKNYLLLIAFAAIVAFMFNPLYQWLIKKGKKPSSAALLTFIASVLAFIIPVIIVLFVSAHQIVVAVNSVKNTIPDTNLNDLLNRIVYDINRFLSSLHIPYQMTLDSLKEGIGNALKAFGESVLQGLQSSISGFFAFFTIAIIYIYVFLSLLTKQDKLTETLHRLNPLGTEISKFYTKRIASMTKAMVQGQFIIALAQGFTDALLLYIAGMHNTFFFFFLLLSALSIIPLGGGIIVIPIGIVMVLTGNIWQGLLVIGGHLLIVTNIDNVLRPRLVPKDSRLDPALTLLAVFSGLKFFGFLGIILGPVIMIIIVTTIQIFMEVFKEIESVDRSTKGKHKRNIIGRLRFWDKQKAN